jgi:hypothetical protein
VRERRKEPREGSEIEPETVCLQTVRALLDLSKCDGVLFVERTGELRLTGKVKAAKAGAAAKASLNRAN